MFETMLDRIERRALAAAAARREALARGLAEALPRGVTAEVVDEGVRISGRGIARRFALDSALRWLVAGLVR